MSRAFLRMIPLALVLVMALAPMAGAAGPAKMAAPVVSLDRIEVQNYFGFWHGTKEDPKDKGNCPLVLAFVFNVQNTNSLPVEMEELKFTYSFDGYDIATRSYTNTMWIPGGKTNQVRVISAITTGTVVLNLAVTAGFKMKEKGDSAGELIKKWWTEIPDSSFPIEISNGTAQFNYEGGSVISAFVGKFGGK